jgi:hypothetical protein
MTDPMLDEQLLDHAAELLLDLAAQALVTLPAIREADAQGRPWSVTVVLPLAAPHTAIQPHADLIVEIAGRPMLLVDSPGLALRGLLDARPVPPAPPQVRSDDRILARTARFEITMLSAHQRLELAARVASRGG